MAGFWRDIARKLSGEAVDEPPKPPSDSTRRPPRLIIGLDFGTSGSKVVIRDVMRRQEDPVAIDFGTPAGIGFNRFVWPSTVAIHSGNLLFGTEAERRSGDARAVVRSMKRQFLRLSGQARQDRSVLGELSSIIPDSGNAITEFLTTMYLADLHRRTMKMVSGLFPGIQDDEVIVHLDVPVASFREHSDEKKVFFRMLRFARSLAGRLPSEPDAIEAGHMWLELRESPPPIPNRGEGREDLVPEAVAAIAGLGQGITRGARDRNFVVVDIGAGTTDLGIFRFPDRDARRAVFYAAKTASVGCDDLDYEICQLLGLDSESTEHVTAIRAGKTKVGDGQELEIAGSELTGLTVDRAADSLRNRCKQHWCDTFGSAYRKERVEERWHHLDVFLVGGGSHIEGFRRIYRNRPWNRVRTVNVKPIERDLQLKAVGASDEPPDDRDLVFLLTALGLSLPRPERPDLRHPGDVPDDPGDRPRGPTGLYDFNADDMWLD